LVGVLLGPFLILAGRLEHVFERPEILQRGLSPLPTFDVESGPNDCGKLVDPVVGRVDYFIIE
jgi:hypothetical protein